jgi:hypothetical protein
LCAICFAVALGVALGGNDGRDVGMANLVLPDVGWSGSVGSGALVLGERLDAEDTISISVWAPEPLAGGDVGEGLVLVPKVQSQSPGGGEVDAPASEDAAQPLDVAAPAVAREDIESIICTYAWSCDTAIRIARCESNLRPDAIGAGSFGLFQLQRSAHIYRWPDFDDWWADAEMNIAHAYELYAGGYDAGKGHEVPGQGFGPWSCA